MLLLSSSVHALISMCGSDVILFSSGNLRGKRLNSGMGIQLICSIHVPDSK